MCRLTSTVLMLLFFTCFPVEAQSGILFQCTCLPLSFGLALFEVWRIHVSVRTTGQPVSSRDETSGDLWLRLSSSRTSDSTVCRLLPGIQPAAGDNMNIKYWFQSVILGQVFLSLSPRNLQFTSENLDDLGQRWKLLMTFNCHIFLAV